MKINKSVSNENRTILLRKYRSSVRFWTRRRSEEFIAARVIQGRPGDAFFPFFNHLHCCSNTKLKFRLHKVIFEWTETFVMWSPNKSCTCYNLQGSTITLLERDHIPNLKAPFIFQLLLKLPFFVQHWLQKHLMRVVQSGTKVSNADCGGCTSFMIDILDNTWLNYQKHYKTKNLDLWGSNFSV